jgi:hypothetical protein
MYTYLPFSDKLHAAAVYTNEVALVMVEQFQPKQVGDVKQVCGSLSQINLYVCLLSSLLNN